MPVIFFMKTVTSFHSADCASSESTHGFSADESKKYLPPLKVLHVEDSEDDSEVIARHIGREAEKLDLIRVESGEEMEEALKKHDFDIVLSDHRMPKFSALEALDMLKKHSSDVPFIVVTGAMGGEEVAIDMMRSGACDYVMKYKLPRLVPAIQRQLEENEIRRAKRDAVEALKRKNQQLETTVVMLEKTQRQLGRTARLRGLGQMAAGVVNDFNNFLSKITGIVEIIEGVQIRAIDPYVNQLKDAGLEATSAVKRLRYFYEVSSVANESEAVDLNKAIEGAVALTRPRVEGEQFSSNAVIEVKTELGELPPVIGEPSEFREVFTNLIFNSCDAMPEGGEIRITSRRLDDCVEVELSDTGRGMTSQVLQQCLEPFFSTKEELGTGLGLPLADGLVQRYGGVLRIKSTPGEGTTIKMRFVISDDDCIPEDSDAECSRRLKILVTDDEKEITYLMTRFLEQDNHFVVQAKNGQEALQTMREHDFDIIISDRAMPEMGGDEFAKKVKRIDGKPKFIMTTGFGDLMLAASELPEGVDKILPKPISRGTLRKALRKLTT